ncbi:MAG: DUF6128 domain-containing protein [Roseburia sp.]|nr:DUF6128 domain-containing protein [Roseburia sp.]
MEYIRKIIYLNEYDRGSCGVSAGFAKISKKKTRLKIEINFSLEGTFREEKIYLLDRDDHTVNKVFFGTIPSDDKKISISREGDETADIKGEVIGIMIGGEHHILCAGTTDADVDVTDFIRQETVAEEPETEETTGVEATKTTPTEKEETEIKAAEDASTEREETEEEPEVKAVETAPDDEEEEIIQVEIEEEHDEAYEYRKIFRTHPNMYPFEDDEIEESVQISPADLSDFPQRFWHLASNSFLLEGYYKYRHLIFVRADGKLYLGIPGQYHRRDKFLADMFGFTKFKSIYNRAVKLGDFGYWLMEIDVMPADSE